jgi:hypothetical protein
MKCFRCEEWGHGAESCPQQQRALDYGEHLARIDRFTARWVAGTLSRESKRKAISAENILWYGEGNPELRVRRLTYP